MFLWSAETRENPRDRERTRVLKERREEEEEERTRKKRRKKKKGKMVSAMGKI